MAIKNLMKRIEDIYNNFPEYEEFYDCNEFEFMELCDVVEQNGGTLKPEWKQLYKMIQYGLV